MVIVTVPPDTPVTTPPAETVAIAVDPLLQVPPMVLSVSGMVWPTHTVFGPRIGDTGSTTTGLNWKQPVPP